MSFMQDFLKNKYPDYDPNHRRFSHGDLIIIDGYGLAVFIEHYPIEVKAYILKSTFGLKAGTYAEVPYTRITGVKPNHLNEKIV